MNKKYFLYIVVSSLSSYSPEGVAGSTMSCLNAGEPPKKTTSLNQKRVQEAVVPPLTPNVKEDFEDALRYNSPTRVARLVGAFPALISYEFNTFNVEDFRMAKTLKELGFSFGGKQGHLLLYNALIKSTSDNRKLIAYCMENGADPNYVNTEDDTILDYTIMNESFRIANDSGYRKHSDLMIQKICLLIEKGASLCVSTPCDQTASSKPLVPYRQNVPWCLKRYLFRLCFFPKSGFQERKGQGEKLLALRTALMKTWDGKRDQIIQALQSTECLGELQSMQPLLQMIANYTIGQTYQALEDAVYYERDQRDGTVKRLLSAPEGNYKSCEHGDRNPCVGPCQAVFKAFGMRKPAPNCYKALKSSKFAIEEVSEATQALPSQIK